MNRYALDADGSLVCRERLVYDLTEFGSVESVCKIGSQVLWQARIHAAADFLVRRKPDSNFSVRYLRIPKQVMGKSHDDCDSCFVIRAEQCSTTCGNNVLAYFGRQIRGVACRKSH